MHRSKPLICGTAALLVAAQYCVGATITVPDVEIRKNHLYNGIHNPTIVDSFFPDNPEHNAKGWEIYENQIRWDTEVTKKTFQYDDTKESIRYGEWELFFTDPNKGGTGSYPFRYKRNYLWKAPLQEWVYGYSNDYQMGSYQGSYYLKRDVYIIPEPEIYALIGLGLVGIYTTRRGRRQARV